MLELIIGSLTFSIFHALIPNHWIPIIAISKAQNWKLRETMFATFITAFFHLLSTMIIGVLIGLAGISLLDKYETIFQIAAPSVLIVLGIIFFILGFKHKHHHHEIKVKSNKSKVAIIISLALGMFFSPCIDLSAFFLLAASHGIQGIVIVSFIYLVVTLFLIMGLVYLGLKGINHFKTDFLEKYTKSITGFVLIILGLMALLGTHSHLFHMH